MLVAPCISMLQNGIYKKTTKLDHVLRIGVSHDNMQLFCLRPYKTGYTGFIEDGQEYAYFQFQRRGTLRKLLRFPKSEFHGYRHFIGGMSKFMPFLFFLEHPIPLDRITIEELDRIHKEIANRP